MLIFKESFVAVWRHSHHSQEIKLEAPTIAVLTAQF